MSVCINSSLKFSGYEVSIFQEEQKFRPLWMVTILIFIEMILVGDLTISILNGKDLDLSN